MKLEKVFSVKQASQLTGLSERKLRDLKDKIGYHKIGSRIYFPLSALEAFLWDRFVPPGKKRIRWLGPLSGLLR